MLWTAQAEPGADGQERGGRRSPLAPEMPLQGMGVNVCTFFFFFFHFWVGQTGRGRDKAFTLSFPAPAQPHPHPQPGPGRACLQWPAFQQPCHVSVSAPASGTTNTVMSSPEPNLSLGRRQPLSLRTPRERIRRSWAARVYLRQRRGGGKQINIYAKAQSCLNANMTAASVWAILFEGKSLSALREVLSRLVLMLSKYEKFCVLLHLNV